MALVSIHEAGGNLAEFNRLNFAATHVEAVGDTALNHLVDFAQEHSLYGILATAEPYLSDHDTTESPIDQQH